MNPFLLELKSILTLGLLSGLALSSCTVVETKNGLPLDHGAAKEELHSPFASTLTKIGIDIPNAHLVDQKEGSVIRGEQPGRKIPQLLKAGVTDILIFRSESSDPKEGSTVQDELQDLEKAGFKIQNVHWIPFPWKNFPNMKIACIQTLEALKVLVKAAHTPRRKIYFHCTVGEDRTGYLAGLYQMLENKWDRRKAFEQELCAHGYAGADPRKSSAVVGAINLELTPLFLHMADLIDSQQMTASQLDLRACDRSIDMDIDLKNWICKSR